MPTKVRVNLADALELLALPGVGPRKADTILTFHAELGPIQDEQQLATILGPRPGPGADGRQADLRLGEPGRGRRLEIRGDVLLTGAGRADTAISRERVTYITGGACARLYRIKGWPSRYGRGCQCFEYETRLHVAGNQ